MNHEIWFDHIWAFCDWCLIDLHITFSFEGSLKPHPALLPSHPPLFAPSLHRRGHTGSSHPLQGDDSFELGASDGLTAWLPEVGCARKWLLQTWALALLMSIGFRFGFLFGVRGTLRLGPGLALTFTCLLHVDIEECFIAWGAVFSNVACKAIWLSWQAKQILSFKKSPCVFLQILHYVRWTLRSQPSSHFIGEKHPSFAKAIYLRICLGGLWCHCPRLVVRT